MNGKVLNPNPKALKLTLAMMKLAVSEKFRILTAQLVPISILINSLKTDH
jgi:hypothetical protein